MRATLSLSRAALAFLVLGTAVADAQQSNASAAATGLGGAFTARAQGYNAVAWNPANLGMPGNQGFSLSIGAFDGTAGIRPIDWSRLAKYSGEGIPRDIREQWLVDVSDEGSQRGDLFGGLTALGLSMGPIALQVSTKAVSSMNFSPDATEALLFGNFGRDSVLRELDLAGTRARSAAYTTVAGSFGMPLGLVPLPNFAVGVTGKYIMGHGVAITRDAGSVIDSLPAYLFPTVITDDETRHDFLGGGAGSGFGLDLGAAWTIPGFRFGVSIQNVVNTFRWDTTAMELQEASGFVNYFGDSADVVKQPYASAPADLRAEVAAMKFKPVIAAGVAFDWIPTLTVSADIRQQVAGGIEVGPESLIGAGAEWRVLPFLPLRGGVQMMTGGFGVAGGFGLRLFGYEAGFAGFVRTRDGSQESGATVNLISIRP